MVHAEGYRVNKTAVDPYPTHSKYWQPQVMQKHHIYVESFINFARYIPNTYELIHFTFTPTEYEYRLAERLLEKDGQIIDILKLDKTENDRLRQFSKFKLKFLRCWTSLCIIKREWVRFVCKKSNCLKET